MREYPSETRMNYFDEALFRVENPVRIVDEKQECVRCKDMVTDNTVEGRIIGVTSDASYKRLFARKVFDKLVYGQRMSDVCNTIIVRSKFGDEVLDTHVCLYGQTAAGIAEVKVGAVAEVNGKFDSRNRFMARQICVDGVRIATQIEMADILLWIAPVAILFFWYMIIIIADGISAMDAYNQLFTKIIVFFFGGCWTTFRGIKKLFRYYLPVGVRLKMSVIGGTIISIILAIIL